MHKVYHTHKKQKKTTSLSPSLVDPGRVQSDKTTEVTTSGPRGLLGRKPCCLPIPSLCQFHQFNSLLLW